MIIICTKLNNNEASISISVCMRSNLECTRSSFEICMFVGGSLLELFRKCFIVNLHLEFRNHFAFEKTNSVYEPTRKLVEYFKLKNGLLE